MFATILSLVLGAASGNQDVVDAIVKARIELAKVKPVVVVKLDTGYALNRERAIKENKVLLVLINSEVKQCTDVGCKPIPNNWIRWRCKEFTYNKEVLKTGIIVSSPKNGELWYLKTVPDWTSIDDIENVINPVVTVREHHWIPCPLCPGGKKWID